MPGSITLRSEQLSGEDGSGTTKKAEDLPILLPSDLDEPRRDCGCLGGVTDTERRFADAMMRDSLINVQRYLRTLTTLRQKTKHTAGSKSLHRSRRLSHHNHTQVNVKGHDLVLSSTSCRVGFSSRRIPIAWRTSLFRDLTPPEPGSHVTKSFERTIYADLIVTTRSPTRNRSGAALRLGYGLFPAVTNSATLRRPK